MSIAPLVFFKSQYSRAPKKTYVPDAQKAPPRLSRRLLRHHLRRGHPLFEIWEDETDKHFQGDLNEERHIIDARGKARAERERAAAEKRLSQASTIAPVHTITPNQVAWLNRQLLRMADEDDAVPLQEMVLLEIVVMRFNTEWVTEMEDWDWGWAELNRAWIMAPRIRPRRRSLTEKVKRFVMG